MDINNSQNLQQTENQLQTQQQNNQPVFPLVDLFRFGYKFLQWYYSDVYWDETAQRYRNSKGEFVSEWKADWFK